MAKLSSIEVDRALQSEGIVVDYHGIKVRLAQQNNPRARELVRRKMGLIKVRDQDGNIPKDDLRRIIREVWAEAVILGWSEMEAEDGTPIPYTPEKALEILSDEKFSDFSQFVDSVSSNAERYFRKASETDLKNSAAPSAGN